MQNKFQKNSKKACNSWKIVYNNYSKTKWTREWEQIPLFKRNRAKRRETVASIEEKVQNLIENKIEELGYQLYDVQYVKEGKDYFLRIYIDKPEGIDLNDCETVNDAISDTLDEASYIKEAYFLEVSSPGIERVLRK